MLVKAVNTPADLKQVMAEGNRDHFSEDGYAALFTLLDDAYGDDVYKVDPIAICGQFSEYTREEIFHEFESDAEYVRGDLDRNEFYDDEDYEDAVYELLMDHIRTSAMVCELHDGAIIGW